MNRVCSIFAQLLGLLPRGEFEQAVGQHKAERHARGFTCWGQLVAMLFCHVGQARSLREICQGLAASEGKLRIWGFLKRRRSPLWRMPMSIGRGNCRRRFSISCWAAV
jgi:hypothetical protein